MHEDVSICSIVQASPEQLMEVEPRSQSPAANSETFAKRNGSVEDLDKADGVERDLESSSYSLDAGGVIQGGPSSNSDYSVQGKVDLRNVQTRKGKSNPAALGNRSGFGSDILNSLPLHNVHFGYYVFLPTEQAETYLKRCVLINYSTYICLCLFGWKENMILKETVTFKL